MYAVGHKGALLGKLVHFSALLQAYINAGRTLMSLLKLPATDTCTVQFLAHEWVVYWLVVLYVLFSPAAASLAPPEQLVLATIRQEASELQDPAQATMRACLTDRFDKSEFAWIGDAPFVFRSPKVHVAMRSS